MRPTSSTTISRPDLGALAYEYDANALSLGFIAGQVLPTFDVVEQTGEYPIIPIEAMLKLPKNTKRAPRTEYSRTDWEFETDYYSCQDHGFEEPLDDVEARMYRRLFDGETVSVQRAMQVIMRVREKRVADKLLSTTYVPANGNAAGGNWSTLASCVPNTDVAAVMLSHYYTYGVRMTKAAMSDILFNYIWHSAAFRTANQYVLNIDNSPKEIRRQMVANFLGLDEVLVGNELYDSALKKKAFSLAGIWSATKLLLFAGALPGDLDLKKPVLGRTFLWTGDSPDILTVEQYREEKIRSEVYRVRHTVDEKLIFPYAGYIMTVAGL